MNDIKKMDNTKVDRTKCNVVIEHIPRLIEKEEVHWWTDENLSTYNNKYIWFRDEGEGSHFRTINLVPYEVSKDFFNLKVSEWKKEGCGYYSII
jgi:hypothetical protein